MATTGEQFLVQQKIVVETNLLKIDLEHPDFIALHLHREVIARLKCFNSYPDDKWREAVVACARKIYASVPSILTTVLSNAIVKKDIQLDENKTGFLSEDQKDDLREYGMLVWKKRSNTTSLPEIAECTLLAKILGIILPERPKFIDWNDERIDNSIFCLIEKGSGLPILHKPTSMYLSPALKCRGYVWTFRAEHNAFNASKSSDAQLSQSIDRDCYRLANFYEIVAMLSSVQSIAGLPPV